MPRRLLRITGALAATYLACLVLVLALQPRLVYFPGPPPSRTPEDLGYPCQTVSLETSDDETLSAWFLPAPEAVGAVVYSHGNAGSIEGRVGTARALVAMGFSVLLYDYRGYGASTGSPDEAGTYLDAEAAYRWVTSEAGFDPSKVVAYGRSLGGAVALELALRQPVAGLFLESTFTSIPDMAELFYPWIPLRWFPGIQYDNLAKIRDVTVQLAVAHSPDDELIPIAMGAALAEAAQAPAEWIEGAGGHNGPGVLVQAGTRERVARFMRALVGG
ncbi:alpha/beta hydrolase [Planctomycetota bacterium]|nr:alpha/beta hydrolase [Planctomycetota bacterium]MDB4450571.1 alpha/beta hydrolase [bacterium]MDB4780275.1 alpha/beta hydrolase [Planctomycetota bacterium]